MVSTTLELEAQQQQVNWQTKQRSGATLFIFLETRFNSAASNQLLLLLMLKQNSGTKQLDEDMGTIKRNKGNSVVVVTSYSS